MAPAIFFAHPQESSTAFHPLPACWVFTPARFYIYPCFISFAVYLPYITAGCSAIHNPALLLLTVKLLYYQLRAVGSPFHARDIVLLCITRHIHFGRSAISYIYYIYIAE